MPWTTADHPRSRRAGIALIMEPNQSGSGLNGPGLAGHGGHRGAGLPLPPQGKAARDELLPAATGGWRC